MSSKQELSSMLSKMINIASTAHVNQFDKGGMPYILHPLAVMQMAKQDGCDIEILCGCIGHDVIEDCPSVTFEMLRQEGISERVITMIANVTKMPGQTYDEYKAKVMSSRDSALVKLYDLRHNTDITRLKGVSPKDIARMEKYFKLYVEIQAFLNQ